MGLIWGFAKVFLVISLSVCFTSAQVHKLGEVFDVTKYGAIPDGKTENSKAFLEAWADACKWEGNAVVWVPKGNYILDSVAFTGEDSPCKGNMAFWLNGALRPTTELSDPGLWITFRRLTGLRVGGRGGLLDGQGQTVWDCGNVNCRKGISISFGFVENAMIENLVSVNSRNAHVSLFACKNVTLSKIKLKAPDESPNTDGVKISRSTDIYLKDSVIGTGDDCVAILRGSRNINVNNVVCGPGHGISVGSMGGVGSDDEVVTGFHVKNCTIKGTPSGLRIKTWATSTRGIASDFTYEDIQMIDVSNPIVIDQFYCPEHNCDLQTQSHVEIKNISYKHIWGTSRTQSAVTFNCSRSVPCKNIVLDDINLKYGEAKPSAVCLNALGTSSGIQEPPSCL